jgi:hypothetical protein
VIFLADVKKVTTCRKNILRVAEIEMRAAIFCRESEKPEKTSIIHKKNMKLIKFGGASDFFPTKFNFFSNFCWGTNRKKFYGVIPNAFPLEQIKPKFIV